MLDLATYKVGDKLAAFFGYGAEIREVARITKTLLIDNKGGRWNKYGRPPGDHYSSGYVEAYTEATALRIAEMVRETERIRMANRLAGQSFRNLTADQLKTILAIVEAK